VSDAASEAPSAGRVLVVDDEPGLLRAAERILGAEHAVATAALPSEAMRLLPNFAPDIVICDIRMPEMDGFDLVERLREIDGSFDVIFMTGAATEPDATLVRALRQHAFFFVQKPFDRQVMLTLVARCLERRRLLRAERDHAERMRRELDDARIVQRGLLPAPNARLDRLDVAARLVSSRELGGDLYDYVATPDGAAFILADVCGHGAGAALLTTVVKSSFRAAAAERFDPRAVMDRLATAFHPFTYRIFVTAVCGCIAGDRLRLTNAGHPDAAFRSEGRTRLLESNAPIVSCLFGPGEWGTEEFPWRDGDRLAICSDGFAEMPRRSMSALAAELRDAVATGDSAASIADGMIARFSGALGGREAPDDVTILVLSQEPAR